MTSSLMIYRDTYACLEAYDRETENIAFESLQSDMTAIAEDLNPKLADYSAKYNAAFSAGKYDDALDALNELEKIVKTWKNRLNALPAEAMSKTILRTTVKIAATLVSIFIICKIGRIQDFIKTALINMGASKGVVFVGAIVGGAAATHKPFSFLFDEVVKFFMTRVKKDEKAQYKNDPNHHNATYVAAQVGLDRWLQGISVLKSDLKNLQADAKKNSESK